MRDSLLKRGDQRRVRPMVPDVILEFAAELGDRILERPGCAVSQPADRGSGHDPHVVRHLEHEVEDLDLMLQMANNMGIMPGTTICGLADGAAWPLKNAIAKFRGELEDYIRHHRSDAALVAPLQERIAHGLPAAGDPGSARLTDSLGSVPDGPVALRGPGPGRA